MNKRVIDNTEELISGQRKRFREFLSLVKDQAPGSYTIEVAEVLIVGGYMVGGEVAIIKDTAGAVWEIPEYKNYDKLLGRPLVSRWSIESGMKLKLVVKESVVFNERYKEITEVTVI